MLMQKKKLFLSLLLICVLSIPFSFSMVQAAPNASQVGYVNFLYLINQHPDTLKANEELKSDQEAAQKEFAEKSAGLSDKDKQDLSRQLGQQLEKRRLELLKPITDKVVSAAQDVAAEKGLTIVISKNDVVCGGVDITADVLKKITAK